MALIDNIRAYYKLEDTSDSAGANTLTNSGTVSFATAGKIGNSAGTFNGVNQRLSRSDAMGFTSTSTNTYNLWVKFNAAGGYLFDAHTNSGASKRHLLYNATDRINSYINASDASVSTGAGSITTGTWYMLTLTHNSGAYELFLNGVSKGTATVGGTGGAGNLFSAGNAADSFGAPMNGLVDEFGVWDRVLTGTEITALYNSGAGLQYPFTTTAIKTINGLAYASVKTVNGLATASVKTFNGLA